MDLDEPVPDLRTYDAIIFAGGEYRPDEFDLPIFQAERVRIMEALETRVPILGICLGHQLLAYWLGGRSSGGVGRSAGCPSRSTTQAKMIRC